MFTGFNKTILVESARRIDIHHFAENIKKSSDVVTNISPISDFIDTDYLEVVSVDLLDEIKNARNLLAAAAEKRIGKDLLNEIKSHMEYYKHE